MPFEQYLQYQGGSDKPAMDSPYHHPYDPNDAPADPFTAPFSSTVQFQIPQFMYTGTPTLAHGGGAEVLPVGMLGNSDMTASWLVNNGFAPRFSSSFHRERPNDTPEGPRLSHPSPASHRSSPLPFDYDTIPSPSCQQSLPSSSIPHSALRSSMSAFANAEDLLKLEASSVLPAPSSLGLPVYSASGFDIISILGRVANRPHPKVVLGPVDLTCSFVVVDTRRHDHPIVYCSPNFCTLTGYEEREVLGRNCRFLQAPGGAVVRGTQRRSTSNEAVSHLKKSLVADKECQTSIVNYRKDGSAFINLVTVIPIAGGEAGLPHEEHEVFYHVGFQVDLTEQPNAILHKLRDGSYMVNYSPGSSSPPSQPTRDRRSQAISPPMISSTLRTMLSDSTLVASLPLSTSTVLPSPPSTSSSEKSDAKDKLQLLNLILLENTPDFIMVVSLKGLFLYVAPSVRNVLGYEVDELLGRSITDYCHPADIVPLTRELKESSAMPGSGADVHPSAVVPRTVDLLFRARRKGEAYVWVECRGRLHVEPGKGRKAILLSARAREMATFPWSHVARGGGLALPTRSTRTTGTSEEGAVDVEVAEAQREFWGTLCPHGTFLSVGHGSADVLGWGAADLVGTSVASYVARDDRVLAALQEGLACVCDQKHTAIDEPVTVPCRMRRKDNGQARVELVLYGPKDGTASAAPLSPSPSIQPSALIYQIKVAGDVADAAGPRPLMHDLGADVFAELDPGRGTSWNYELQQLKIANQKLLEEISLLEAQQMQTTRRQHESPSHSAAYGSVPQPPVGWGAHKRRWDEMEAAGRYSSS